MTVPAHALYCKLLEAAVSARFNTSDSPLTADDYVAIASECNVQAALYAEKGVRDSRVTPRTARIARELEELLGRGEPGTPAFVAVTEGVLRFEQEDGGRSMIAETPSRETVVNGSPISPADRFFVRVHSYDDSKRHPECRALDGKRVRVTVETTG